MRPWTLLVLIGFLAACSSEPKPAPPPAPDAGLQVAAALLSPTDIVVESRGHAPDAAGHIVEFATEPNGDYTILEFQTPSQRRFDHPDVVPETTFYYRARDLFGPASSPIEVVLPPPPPGENIDKDGHEWAVPTTLPVSGHIERRPIRGSPPDPGAAPTDLKATIKHSQGIHFTWTDRASDEQGYLLEIRPDGQPDFRVVALIDPDINSFGLITLPHEKKATFRVRAFYYGQPSNIAKATSGPEKPGS